MSVNIENAEQILKLMKMRDSMMVVRRGPDEELPDDNGWERK